LVRAPIDGIAVREAEDEGVADISAVLVAGKEKALIESGMKRRATAKSERGGTGACQRKSRRSISSRSSFPGKRSRWERNAIGSATLCSTGTSLISEIASRRTSSSAQGDGMSMTLQDVYCQAYQRQCIWLGLMVTGDVATYVKGEIFVGSLSYVYAHRQWRIAPALQTHVSSFILSNADQHNEVQPKQIRIVKVPEYFAEYQYREKGDGLTAFLGSSIVVQAHLYLENGLCRKRTQIDSRDVCISFLILTPFWYSLCVVAYVTIIEPVGYTCRFLTGGRVS
jgi:actin-related protein 9